MDATEKKKWYVLYTRPQHEKKIAAFLQENGIDQYLPLISRKRRWSDRMKIIDFPLFPGYIFVRIAWATGNLQILKHPGAIAFIRNEGVPASMSAKEMENMKLLVKNSTDIESNPEAIFPAGQEIEIQYGPLKGIRGVVTRIKNIHRIFVRIPLLNRTISTEIDIMDVERV